MDQATGNSQSSFQTFSLNEKLDSAWATIRSNLDLDYLSWLAYFFTPIIVAFLLPVVILVLLYGNALFVHIYKLRYRLREAYARDFWDGARSTLASFWDAHGTVWHGYELVGLENIPDEGPALIVYYHGTLPVDVYYLMARCILYKRRVINCVGDKFLFKVPGWKTLMEVFCVTPGTVESCLDLLRRGEIVCISPGGVREALFSDSRTYNLMWRQRFGFVKIAMEARVPVIPMFTENCREAFRTPRWGRRMLRKLYEYTRIPLVPIYGGFPVKMRTYLGLPVEYNDESMTQEEFRNKEDKMNSIDIKTAPYVVLETSMGRITVELYWHHAPLTCRNFAELAYRSYYNNTVFHRVISDFMIQGGDPTGTGRGGSSIYGPTFEDEISNELKHTGAGVLSMANAGPNTNASQFFITLAPTQWLDGKHTIFGRVATGMKIVAKIGMVQTDSNDKPTENIRIIKAYPKTTLS